MIKKILIMMYTEMSFCFAFAVQDFPGGKESAYKKKKKKNLPAMQETLVQSLVR